MGWIALARIGGGGKNGSSILRIGVSLPLSSAMDPQSDGRLSNGAKQ
jgi:hypothetical protein